MGAVTASAARSAQRVHTSRTRDTPTSRPRVDLNNTHGVVHQLAYSKLPPSFRQ